MNRKIFLIIIIAAVTLLSVGAFWLWNNRNAELIQSANYPGAMSKQKDGSKIILSTKSGEVVIENIFEKNKTIFNEAGDPEKTNIISSKNFTFDYYYNGDYFAAYLLSQPVKEARNEAETAILETLGVSKEDACKITNLTLYISSSVDENLGADEKLNYGLSWCPEAYNFN